MKYILWIFIPVLILGQVRTVPQTGVRKQMIRGDLTTLTWVVPGDYTADSLLFVVKNSADPSAARQIQKSTGGNGLTATYSSPNTTITATINTANTQNFTAASYYYDVTSVTDSITLVIGILVIKADVSTPADGIATSTPYYTVALDTPSHSPSFIIGEDSDNSWNVVSKADVKDTLDIYPVNIIPIGDTTVANSWRIILRSDTLTFERKEIGGWAEKFTIGTTTGSYFKVKQ